MNYKKLLVSSIFLISCSILNLSAQNLECGLTNHNKAIQAYYKKDYTEATSYINQAIACHSNYFYYYDAACIAAKFGDNERAFSMLEKSIEKGWANMSHLKDDNDLETLKKDKRWIELFGLKAEVKKDLKIKIEHIIETSNSTSLIPFQREGKWGYVDSKDNAVISEAIFDKASFLNPKARLVFGQYYIDIGSIGIIKWLEDPMFSEEIKTDRYKVDSILSIGFSVKANKYYTNDYGYAKQYDTFKGHSIKGDFIGVVKDENGVSVIDQAGAVKNNIRNLDKVVFHNFGDDAKNNSYPVNDKYGDFVLFFKDKKGHLGYIDNTFTKHLLSKKTNLSLPNRFSYSNTKQAKKVNQYVFILKKEKYGIWDCISKSWVFKPRFDSVLEVNSLTTKDRKTSTVYFLVKEKGKTYQIDKDGKIFYPEV